ncbi:MAG: LysR family transcriptional regulator [Christensenellaceae bacterium]|jgi:DNA-binding transcriptional LysR family regulator|nr:LysR family transcriptional regulator [Christensenellaceae bacterium]
MEISTVNYNRYKVFVALYETGSMIKAAEKLACTQPTITYNIRDLETELGVTLFHCHPRGVDPTEDGKILYEKIKHALTIIAEAEESVKTFNEKSGGTIRLGCPSYICSTMILDFIIDFNNKYPNIQIELYNMLKKDLNEMLHNRKIDIVLDAWVENTINEDKKEHPNFSYETLCALPYSFIASKELLKNNKLSETPTAKELSSLPFIKSDNRLSRQLFSLLGDKLKFAYAYPLSDTTFRMVEKGLAASFACDNYIDSTNVLNNIVKIKPEGFDFPKYELVVVYNSDHMSKAGRAFSKALHTFFLS